MESVHILEFGTYLAGPLVGRYLSDFGCKVTCITRPAHSRGACEEQRRMQQMVPELRRGKTMVEIDLLQDLHLAQRLVQTSTVIVENFKPGTMDKLGLGFEACKVLNPNILYKTQKTSRLLAFERKLDDFWWFQRCIRYSKTCRIQIRSQNRRKSSRI